MSLGAYFSHSWKPDFLPLNLAIWERIHGKCHLLIDRPVQEGDTAPPYHISRIEALMQRADLFIACLPGDDRMSGAGQGDWGLRCSPYILFEIRMAERSGMPLFIVYDPNTSFRPPEHSAPGQVYVPRRIAEVNTRIEQGATEDGVLKDLSTWTASLENLRPREPHPTREWACLVGAQDSALRSAVVDAVRQEGWGEPVAVDGVHTDSGMSRLARSLGLVVADVGAAELMPAYHYLHALTVPAIRIVAKPDDTTDQHLPPILRGHPAGYQHDTLSAGEILSDPSSLVERVRAVERDVTPIAKREKGIYELQQRGYVKHLVFLSHDRKGKERSIVTRICEACERLGIDYWEYEERNQSGEHWKHNLDQALDAMTLFVPLLSDTYEHSTTCLEELDRSIERGILALPFFIGDRQRPNPKLRDSRGHHKRLAGERTEEENSETVARTILSHIRR